MKAQPYLIFSGEAREAFDFYQGVFGGEFQAVMNMSDNSEGNGYQEKDANRILHISLAISEDILLMASDMPSDREEELKTGNNMYVSLHPDTKEDADQIFKELAAGGEVKMPLADQFWGDYFGSLVDKYGVHWMINYSK